MELKENIELKPYTNYKIGGPARYFVEAKSEKDIEEAIGWAKKEGVSVFVLGGGTNILVSDSGFDGLVIHIALNTFSIKGTRLTTGAGVSVQELVDATVEASRSGLEWAGGLPGSIGGAIHGNAGAFGGETKDHIVSVRALSPKGVIQELSADECRFSYRTSIFKEEEGWVIFSALFELKRGDKEELRASVEEHRNWRHTKHPIEYGNCGSVFKRVGISDLPKGLVAAHPDISSAIRGDQVATAYFIDACGLKLRRVGDVQVSEKHPNFLINRTGNARAEDVLILIGIVKHAVQDKFGIALEQEVEDIGF
ncbi:MAG: UDP-N-acetylmuramate dehydrogenase [Candidatus Spechtbacterales bacterium]